MNVLRMSNLNKKPAEETTTTALIEAGEVLSDNVYTTLKSQLMKGQLLPLQRLKVRDLAKELGTSETPVREALIQLSREGAIEIKPRYYIRVRKLNATEYSEIRAMRMELESMAAERALPHITPDDIIHLENIHHRLIASEKSGDWPEALQTNFDFHFLLYRRSKMQHLLNILEALWTRIGPILSELYPHASPSYAGQHQHELVLKALRERDSYALRMAIRMDLIEGGAALIRHLKSETK